ncbi:hypothetical protein ACH5RR_007128 [Cinchona calisaya]|uniref:Uncharacterized protein n=1 Tax=Cinchona calisaya TaxID=153742 RepID=A0ABD3ARD6_9GENT
MHMSTAGREKNASSTSTVKKDEGSDFCSQKMKSPIVNVEELMATLCFVLKFIHGDTGAVNVQAGQNAQGNELASYEEYYKSRMVEEEESKKETKVFDEEETVDIKNEEETDAQREEEADNA